MEVEVPPKENGTESSDTSEIENAENSQEKNAPENNGSDSGSDKKETNDNDEEMDTQEKNETEEETKPTEEKINSEVKINTEQKMDTDESKILETNGTQDKGSEGPANNTPGENGIEGTSENDESQSGNQEKQCTEYNNDDNYEEDDDFNPLLLCPDISMDVEESPVVTTPAEQDSTAVNDMLDSNALFAPLFSTFVDEMTGAEISFNLNPEEQQLREKLYGPNNPIQHSKIHCTACNVHLGSGLAGQTNRFVHPLLKVLICKECYHFYTSGEFEKDEDGSELYCRWCGQGGQVLCCSKCEFVFCKKCIRINFGRKKLTEVRDSDEWKCFRCDMSQLKALRAMCVEFFEYVRRETARAATIKDPEFINRDLTNCCQTQLKKRLGETEENEKEREVKRPRRKKNEEDPDYNPFAAQQEEKEEKPPSPVPSTSGVTAAKEAVKPLPPLLPKPTVTPNVVSFPGKSPSATVRIGDTILNVKSVVATVATTSVKGSPTFAARSPNVSGKAPAVVGPRNRQTFTPRTPTQTASPRTPAVMSTPSPTVHNRSNTSRPSSSTNTMKHEWFEKTVRAAARVNSNLSYTLTQLNKAQASASSVEQLAVVHNKLQEILSSSINSLIQIRKNLRTEFIAGIKTIRFPPKTPVDPNDDDVIIVNPTPDLAKANQAVLAGLPQISVKKANTPNRATNNNNKTTTPTSNVTPTRGYLKVKSFSQLQTVTSECITIPDDDPPCNEKDDEPVVVSDNMMPQVEKDPLADDPPAETNEIEENSASEEVVSVVKEPDSGDKDKDASDNSEKKEESDTTSEKKEESNSGTGTITEEITEKSDGVENTKENSSDINKEKDTNKENGELDIDNKDKDNQKQQDNQNENKEKDASDENEGEDAGKKSEEAHNETNEEGANVKSKNDTNTEQNKENAKTNCEKLSNGTSEDSEVQIKQEPGEADSYNVKEKPSPKIRRMLSVKVNLKKTPAVEDMVKQEPVENGGE